MSTDALLLALGLDAVYAALDSQSLLAEQAGELGGLGTEQVAGPVDAREGILDHQVVDPVTD